MNPQSVAQRFLLWPVLGAVVFFGILWGLGFPQPMIDDLFYSGAGLNLAAGGDFSNPFLARQQFPSHYFFVYPPLHSYALAGWLNIFGISALAMTGFQIVMYVIIAIATIGVLRQNAAPVWLEWLVPLGVGAAFLRAGLRPEPFATALTMTGFALIECGRREGFSIFAAFLLMFLGASAAPRMTLFAAALIGCASWRLLGGSSAAGWRRWGFCGYGSAAFLATSLLFLALIHFRLGEFLTTFHFHAAGARARDGRDALELFGFFLRALGFAQWPLLVLLPVFLSFALWQSKAGLAGTGILLSLAFLAGLLMGGLGFGAGWYAFLIMLFVAPTIIQNGPRLRANVLVVALVMATLFGNSKTLVNIFGIIGGQIKNEVGESQSTSLALQPTTGHTLVVDIWAARYVYGYRLSPDCINFEFGARFPRKLIITGEFAPGDIFVLGPEGVEELNKHGMWDKMPAKWTPLSLDRWAYYRYPRKASIIPAASCRIPARVHLPDK